MAKLLERKYDINIIRRYFYDIIIANYLYFKSVILSMTCYNRDTL